MKYVLIATTIELVFLGKQVLKSGKLRKHTGHQASAQF